MKIAAADKGAGGLTRAHRGLGGDGRRPASLTLRRSLAPRLYRIEHSQDNSA